jgi:hypothetical protein
MHKSLAVAHTLCKCKGITPMLKVDLIRRMPGYEKSRGQAESVYKY